MSRSNLYERDSALVLVESRALFGLEDNSRSSTTVLKSCRDSRPSGYLCWVRVPVESKNQAVEYGICFPKYFSV